MKSRTLAYAPLFLALSFWSFNSTEATTPESYQEVNQNQLLQIEQLPEISPSELGLVQIQTGRRTLNHFALSNEYYHFDYPSHYVTWSVEIQWESARLAQDWSLRLGFGYTNVAMQTKGLSSLPSSTLNLDLFPISLGPLYHIAFPQLVSDLGFYLGAGLSLIPYVQTGDVDGFEFKGRSDSTYLLVGLRHKLTWLGLRRSYLTLEYRDDQANTKDQAQGLFSGKMTSAGWASQF